MAEEKKAATSKEVREGVCGSEGLSKLLALLCLGMKGSPEPSLLMRSAWLRVYANGFAEPINCAHSLLAQKEEALNHPTLIPRGRKMTKKAKEEGSECTDCGCKIESKASVIVDSAPFCPACAHRPQLCTCFIALNECSAKTGAQCVLVGSHKYSGFGAPGLTPIRFKSQAKGKEWHIAEMSPGDVLFMHSKLARGSLQVKDARVRASIDLLACLKPSEQSSSFGTTPTTKAILGMKDFVTEY